MLLSYGIQDSSIKACAGTGLVVDLQGKGVEVASDPEVRMIALRADMDALPMPENNPTLSYRT